MTSQRTEDRRLLGFLRDCGCVDKVVAQCYEGSSVVASGLNEVQAKVKETAPKAHFFHCHAHDLRLVMTQGVSKIKECKVFFSHLSSLVSFFNRSAERTKMFEEICHLMCSEAPSHWCFNSRLVCTVGEKIKELIKMFEHIVDHSTEFDDDTVHCADGYVTLLNSFDFCFLLKTFNTIVSSTHVVRKTLKDYSFDVQSCLTKVDELYRITLKQKDKFDMVYETHALDG